MMADLCGFQNEILLQNEPANAKNAEDFTARIDSLQPVWDNIVPISQWASNVLWTSNGCLYEVQTSYRRPLNI